MPEECATRNDPKLHLGLQALGWTRTSRLAGSAIVCLHVTACLWRLTQFNLGRDEIFSLEVAQRGWQALLTAVAADVVHPPLFYLLLKIWIAIGGESLRCLKLFPAVTAILVVIPFLLLCRELKVSAFATNVALLLTAVNGYLVAHAHELRMYSLLLLLSLLALWQFVRFLNSPRPGRIDLLTLLAAHVLLVYTHYYGWLMIAAEFLFVLLWWRRRWRIFATLLALTALSFVPWALAVVRALNVRTVGLSTQLQWHARPELDNVVAFYALLNGPIDFSHSTTMGLLIFSLIILWAGWDIRRAKALNDPCAHRIFYLLGGLAGLPVVIAFSLSRLFQQSIWHPRYLIVSAVPYLLLVALALARLRPRFLRGGLTLLVIAWAAASGFTEMRRTDTHIAWDSLAREMRQADTTRSTPIKVYMLDDFPRYPMGFFLHATGDKRFEFVRIDPAGLQTLFEAHYWVVYNEGSWIDGPAPPEVLRARGAETGPPLSSGPRGHRYILFSVWRR